MSFQLVQQQFVSQKYFKPRPSIVLLLIFCFLTGVLSHLIIYFHQLNEGIRVVHSLFMGLCYDLMIASLITFFAIIFLFCLRSKFERLIIILFYFIYSAIWFIDINYYFVFGTHIPFHTLEYLDQLENFTSNILDILGNYTFIVILITPNVLFFLFTWFYLRKNIWISNINLGITLFYLILLGSISGVYPNSYVAKNMNDPLTSSAVNYFYWSRKVTNDEKINKPAVALQKVIDGLTGVVPQEPKYTGLPLARHHSSDSCSNGNSLDHLASALCSDHNKNVLIILLESFRASEIDSYGSEMGLTPHFKKWEQQGILFENFYANGFQTRHGEIATYCSIMPNYGDSVFSHYQHNHFLCLPELLKQSGYSTSWVHNADAAFDNQLIMLPKIGFQKIIDRFDFDLGTEVLGWGYSDEALFNKWISFLNGEKEPFFSTALTITNHHPFDVPEKFQRFENGTVQNKYYEAVGYVDSVLNQFLLEASKTRWFKNTLIFITADTSNYQNPQKPFNHFEDFVKTRTQIPLLIVGGNIKHSYREKRYFSQIDLAPTIIDVLGFSYTNSWMGKSMLKSKHDSLAFTNRPGNYWAVMSQKGRYYNEADQKDHFFGFSENENLKNKYKQIGKAWIDTTRWLLQENKIWHP